MDRKTVLLILLPVAVSITIGIIGFYYILDVYRNGLPTTEQVTGYKPVQTSIIYSTDDIPIAEFFQEDRTLITIGEAPRLLKSAFLVVEDKDFYSHSGIDLTGITRAVLRNIRSSGSLQGGSTITQQLARNSFLTIEQTFSRKFKEILLSFKLERLYSKDEILEMYINQIYFAHGSYGVGSASRRYFNKPVSQLTLPECALLAALPKAPNYYSPIKHPERALQRRNLVLRLMLDAEEISGEEYREALDMPLISGEGEGNAPPAGAYFIEMVRREIAERYGNDTLYKEGLRIFTTLNLDYQKKAEAATRQFMQWFEEEQKYPVRRTEDGIRKFPVEEPVTDDPDEPPKGSMEQYVQCALVSIDPRNGHILTMVGGRDFETSEFNRATQAKRQPGSAFKPVLYTSAIRKGYTPASLINDEPLNLEGKEGETWSPENYTERFYGPVRLREALRWSRNLAAINLGIKIGLHRVVDEARTLGYKGNLPRVPSLSIGSGETTLTDLTTLYCVFPNMGLKTNRVAIRRIEDGRGRIIEQNMASREQVLTEQEAYIMHSMLKTVVDSGTAQRMRWTPGMGRPVAGKTGTTNDFRDAWFIGYTPDIVTGVWVGFDDNGSLGRKNSGTTVAVPYWTEYMKRLFEQMPVTEFKHPKGILTRKICEITGLLACPTCPADLDEEFIQNTRPRKICTLHVEEELLESNSSGEGMTLDDLGLDL